MRHKRPASSCYRSVRDVLTGVAARAALLPLAGGGLCRRKDHFKSVWENGWIIPYVTQATNLLN
jgi:hypothetical protein